MKSNVQGYVSVILACVCVCVCVCLSFLTVFDAGLDYLTEYQMEDPNSDPCYICDLCQSKMDMRQVITHVVGIKHRHKYLVCYQALTSVAVCTLVCMQNI